MDAKIYLGDHTEEPKNWAIVSHPDETITLLRNHKQILEGTPSEILFVILQLTDARQIGVQTLSGKDFLQPSFRGRTRKLIESIIIVQTGEDRWEIEDAGITTYSGTLECVIFTLLDRIQIQPLG